MKQTLKTLIDNIASQPTLSPEEVDAMMDEAFSIAQTPDERREAGAYLAHAIGRRKRPDINVKEILGEINEALNLAYIAKRYFGKDRNWLYQRLNNSIVNGKPAAFTESELRVLSDSLNELSNKIHQISVQLSH